MFDSTLTRVGTLCLVFLLGTSLLSEVYAQVNPRGNRGRPAYGQNSQEQEAPPQPVNQPFISGVYVGVGINTYQGDLDSNPNDNILKHLGGAQLDVVVGVDKRFGEYEQFGIGAQVSYDRISGQNIRNLEFTNNLISLEFTGSYELPYIKQDLLRVFLGGGPMFVISPTYTGFPAQDPSPDSEFKELGTRVVGSIVGGVLVSDKVRIGARVSTTDFLDGHSGITGAGPVDLLGFITVGYRFNLNEY
ncbi:hypothetical protein CRI94_02545 [Longibacter salinarum]|uniref:Outer membrane protein beta-barrel domain-containing protein n=1 Tax=Longibacter salinarum TaxID=1850348 RepID=A0A2A8D2J5_9BACT|nr:hypothetical protein [Longibacter salinarum]PEN15182.1 hypothetical protein CRI94_02545 [Longibacter salinarum]